MARRDLQADWQDWSVPERVTALAVLAGLAVISLLLLTRSLAA